MVFDQEIFDEMSSSPYIEQKHKKVKENLLTFPFTCCGQGAEYKYSMTGPNLRLNKLILLIKKELSSFFQKRLERTYQVHLFKKNCFSFEPFNYYF